MSMEIQRHLYGLIPESIAIVSLCLFILLVWNLSRWITVRHYLNHHMADMVAAELKEKTEYIRMLEEENFKMLDELKHSRISLKIIRNALMVE